MAKNSKAAVSFPMRLSHEVERLFDEMIHRPWGSAREIRGWNPSVDVYETPEAFLLEADLPGVNAEDVFVEVINAELVLRGSRSIERGHIDRQVITIERSSGHFLRRIKLPQTVDEDRIDAEFRQGVLRVTVPKLQSREGDSAQ